MDYLEVKERCRNLAVREQPAYLLCLEIVLTPGSAKIAAIVDVLVHILQEMGCRDLCQHSSKASALATHGCKPTALRGILIPAVM